MTKATDGYAAIVIKTFETKEAARTFAAKLANLINGDTGNAN